MAALIIDKWMTITEYPFLFMLLLLLVPFRLAARSIRVVKVLASHIHPGGSGGRQMYW